MNRSASLLFLGLLIGSFALLVAGECSCDEEQPPPPPTTNYNPCDVVRCGWGAQCRVIKGKATCECPSICLAIYKPVCGTDGVTYSSIDKTRRQLDQTNETNNNSNSNSSSSSSSSSNNNNNNNWQQARQLESFVHYLAPGETYKQLRRANDLPILALLESTGPDMKPASGFVDTQNVTIEVARRAWTRMRDHAERVANDRIDLLLPFVEKILYESNVSRECQIATAKVASAARQLETWAIKLLNSWGSFPPVGIFEGTLGEIGSFHGCLNLRPPEARSSIKHAHYCTLSYRPILPTRRDYELIINQEPSELVEHFKSTDTFSELAKKSQYNHYVYFKFGTCLPIECSPLDAQKLAKLFGRRGVLIGGPVKCHSKFEDDYEQEVEIEQEVEGGRGQFVRKKLELSTRDLNRGVYIWKPHMTRAQLVALVCLCALVTFIVVCTLADLALNRIPRLFSNLSLEQTSETTKRTRVHANGKRDDADADDDELTLEPLTVMNHDTGASSAQVQVQVEGTQARQEEQQSSGVKGEIGQFDLNNNEQDDESERAGNEGCVLEERIKVDLVKLERHATPAKQANTSGQAAQVKRSRCQVEGNASLLAELVSDFSLITNTSELFTINERQLSSDILCMNGLRCITMSWIILAHTIQYNDWSAFARIYEVESQLDSLMNQPIFNASYLVDTFFLMSGLLTSFSVFRKNKKVAGRRELRPSARASENEQVQQQEGNNTDDEDRRDFEEILRMFSYRSYLIGRYLRLTPQIWLVSLLFILLPLASNSSGPHWYSMTGEYSENCSNNWWINLLHIQAFYKQDEMCNFVCWWISVDMTYHLLALIIILTILKLGPRALVRVCSIVCVTNLLYQASRHYQMALPPNMLSTIPQTGAMWSQMTLNYFWTPSAHLFPFLLGFSLGFVLARHRLKCARWFSKGRALAGWLISAGVLLLVLFGTRDWVTGKTKYTRLGSSSFSLLAQIGWSLSLAWTIVACQLGFGSFINRALSCRLFIVLGKASYLVYLSHFLVLFTFFGAQNLLLEPTRIMIIYIIISNICLSTIFGCLLCVAFEMPWLKVQRRIMRRIS